MKNVRRITWIGFGLALSALVCAIWAPTPIALAVGAAAIVVNMITVATS